MRVTKKTEDGNAVKLDRFRSVAQFTFRSLERELDHYSDLADYLHLKAPNRKPNKFLNAGGFTNPNVTPQVPLEEPDHPVETFFEENISLLKKLDKPFDFWGVFNGEKRPTGPGYEHKECNMTREEHERMLSEVSHLFVGWEIGEFDGLFKRDILYYVPEEKRPTTRREGHDLLMKYLRGMHERLHHCTKALIGCTFAHYMHELPVRMLGAEGAQALLNTQVYVSFLRGAKRQYGYEFNLIFSMIDRWGQRVYRANCERVFTNEDGVITSPASPHHGHSVGFLQASWVLGYFAGACSTGIDGGYYTDELDENGVRKLSPLGEAMVAFTRWSRTPHPRGEQIRPLGIVLDYYAGWAPPRHLYSYEHRVVWHSIPYGLCDHATDQAYNTFYPGYTESGYYRDERGFITPTPSGDSVDVLLSDASPDALSAYPVLWYIADTAPADDVVEKLEEYVRQGGHLVLGGEPLIGFAERVLSLDVPDCNVQAVAAYDVTTGRQVREPNYTVRPLSLDDEWKTVIQTEQGLPVIATRPLGKGKLTILTPDHGLGDELTAPGFDCNRRLEYTPDPPYELLNSVQEYILSCVDEHLPVKIIGREIYYAVNQLEHNSYVLSLYNPGERKWNGLIELTSESGRLTPISGPWSGAERIDGHRIVLVPNGLAVFKIETENLKRKQ